ncbi:hypothetical protein MTsN4n12_01560 [Microbacterium sp. MTN4-12]
MTRFRKLSPAHWGRTTYVVVLLATALIGAL